MAELIWTRFPDRTAATATERRMEWADLVRYLADPGEFPAKAACPWLKLAQFGPHRSARGSLRHDGNVLGVYGVEGDYDGELVPPHQAIAALERAGIKACIYTSPSHTPDAPRWRVLAPLATPHAPGDRSHILARINGVLGGILTAESFTLSQSYYFGRVRGVHYQVLATWDDPDEGNYVDQLDDLDAVAINRAPVQHSGDGAGRTTISEVVERLGRRLRTGDERRDLLKRYIGAKAARGLCDDEIRALVDDQVARFFDPADPIDWSDVNALIRDITSAESAQQEAVQATVGAFVSRVGSHREAPTDLVLTVEQLYTRAGASRWAVKGIVPECGLGFIFGASGTFKSFIALDYALHRAYGMAWMGRRTKQAVPVYLAAEGGAGLMRRIEAWHMARGMDWRRCPMRVVIVPLTLRTQARMLCDAVRATGVMPGDLIIDTMSQTFTGNENSNDEVADFLRILGTDLRDALGCTVSVVHHSGHSATERPRGASAIIANIDFALGVFRDEKEMLATVEFVKVKDSERPDQQAFDLAQQQLGHDSDGDPITSLVATHINNAANLLQAVTREGSAGRGGRNSILLGLLQNGMTEKELRKAFYEAADIADPEARKKAFYRARDWAISARVIEVVQGIIIVLQEKS